MRKESETQTQLIDGQWGTAIPLPYYKDTRPWYVKFWHIILAIRGCFISNNQEAEAYDDALDVKMDKWMKPSDKDD